MSPKRRGLRRSQDAPSDGLIDDSLKRVIDAPVLAGRGNELRERMHQVGFTLATALVAMGEIGPLT